MGLKKKDRAIHSNDYSHCSLITSVGHVSWICPKLLLGCRKEDDETMMRTLVNCKYYLLLVVALDGYERYHDFRGSFVLRIQNVSFGKDKGVISVDLSVSRRIHRIRVSRRMRVFYQPCVGEIGSTTTPFCMCVVVIFFSSI